MKDDDSWQEAFEEENIYSKKARKKLVEEDVLSNEEDGFMQGYEEIEENHEDCEDKPP